MPQFFDWKLVQNENPELPEPKETFAAMSRVNYHLKFIEILPWQVYLLTEIQENKSAQTMSGLLHAVSVRSNKPMQHLLADASLWLPFAIETGLMIEA